MTTPHTAASRNARVEHLMGAVHRIARKMKRRLPAHVDVDDLVGAGALGLAMALEREDESDPRAFDGYALQRIRGAMLDELRRLDPLTRRGRVRAAAVAAARRSLSQRAGSEAGEDEIAVELGLSREELQEARLLEAAGGANNIDPTYDGEGALRQIADTNSRSADEHLELVEDVHRTRVAIQALPDRLRTVVELSCHQEMKLRDIGRELGVTEARACQLRSEAFRRLKKTLCVERSLEIAA